MNNAALQSGTELFNGHYKIERVAGRGGLGYVYLARDRNGAAFAIKESFDQNYVDRGADGLSVQPNRSVKNAERIHLHQCSRAQEEYAIFQNPNLKHSSLVPLVQVFEQNQTVYLVMPFIVGETLNQVVKGTRRFDAEWVMAILNKIGKVLTLLHREKMIHRDLKPDNILITTNSQGESVPVVLDTGATRSYDQVNRIHTGISTDFGAPEIEGTSFERMYGKPGPESDCFALAGMAYMLLSGEKPSDWKARSAAIEHNGIDSLKVPEKLNKEVWQVLKKSLSLMVAQRHGSVTVFLNELLISLHKAKVLENLDKLKRELEPEPAPIPEPYPRFKEFVPETPIRHQTPEPLKTKSIDIESNTLFWALMLVLIGIVLTILALLTDVETAIISALILFCVHLGISWILIEKNIPLSKATFPILNILRLMNKK